ncbi:choline transporter [Paramyrothecium foliicola]|nr:choline transporter [Paramyrothecium foliicola]
MPYFSASSLYVSATRPTSDPPGASSDKKDISQLHGDSDHVSVAQGAAPSVDVDDAILRANGHNSELKRQFNWLSALGLGFSITNSWAGYLSNFGQNLNYGGPQVCLFALIVAWVVQFIITLGLSEIASAFPSTGGQYHFCFILTREKHKRFTAYIVGWMSMLAWWTVTCSGVSLCAVVLSGMISFIRPEYEAQSWHIYLFYAANTIITAIPVFIISKRLAYIVQAGLYISVFGMIVYLLVPIGMHKNTNDASSLTQSGLGVSGWSPGMAWMLGITNAMYAFGGTDAAIHISEEMPQSGKRVPQVMILTMFIGFLTSFPLFLALMYFMTDLDAVRTSPLPAMEIMYQVTGSRSVTIFLTSWLLVCFMGKIFYHYYSEATLDLTVTGSLTLLTVGYMWKDCLGLGPRCKVLFPHSVEQRKLTLFENGTPFPKYFTKVDRRLEFPVRTTIAALVFVLLYGLLYLASSTAFNSIITSAVLFLNISYAIPQGILLFQGRKSHLPPRYLKLGWLGYFCNVFSICWIVVLGIFVCMPPSLPVTTQSMNYICVIAVGLFSIILGLWWIDGRKNFEGPKIDWDLIREANTEMLQGGERVKV